MKNVKFNPSLKFLKNDDIILEDDWEVVLRDGTSEPDVKSSECISIEFDHLEKASKWSEVSLSDFQVDDSGGSTSSDDPWIIRLKHVSNTPILWKGTDIVNRFLIEQKVSVRRYEQAMKNPLIGPTLTPLYMRTLYVLLNYGWVLKRKLQLSKKKKLLSQYQFPKRGKGSMRIGMTLSIGRFSGNLENGDKASSG